MHTFFVYQAITMGVNVTFLLGDAVLGYLLIVFLFNRRNDIIDWHNSRFICTVLICGGSIFLLAACLLLQCSSAPMAIYAAVILSTGYIVALAGTVGYFSSSNSATTDRLSLKTLETKIAVFCAVGWGLQFIIGTDLLKIK